MYEYYVYIMTNRQNGVLYVGMTDNLFRRVQEHKNGIGGYFTSKYKLDKLVYFESTDDVAVAIWREKRLKTWNRGWKIKLIEEKNPQWRDLYDELFENRSSG